MPRGNDSVFAVIFYGVPTPASHFVHCLTTARFVQPEVHPPKSSITLLLVTPGMLSLPKKAAVVFFASVRLALLEYKSPVFFHMPPLPIIILLYAPAKVLSTKGKAW
ncbi:MAG: hypothetical protein LKE53_07605 [Oscillospiraceae bacterium]|jgi:hypothetical protein|nr:hypothetical protein [Oscillospiraceae bacterium]